MKRIFVRSGGAESWQGGLAKPDKHWKTGYSAKALAHCWEEAEGFPAEVERMFAASGVAAFRDLEALLVLVEYKVPLPGGTAASQNDVFVLGGSERGLVCIAVEGKVAESFRKTMDAWLKDASKGKQERLTYLKDMLGLDAIPGKIRYQLMHRTASAVIEAERFGARRAVMLVHSFSPEDEGLEDYQAFLGLYGVSGRPGKLVRVKRVHGVHLYCGWVRGDAKYLEM